MAYQVKVKDVNLQEYVFMVDGLHKVSVSRNCDGKFAPVLDTFIADTDVEERDAAD